MGIIISRPAPRVSTGGGSSGSSAGRTAGTVGTSGTRTGGGVVPAPAPAPAPVPVWGTTPGIIVQTPPDVAAAGAKSAGRYVPDDPATVPYLFHGNSGRYPVPIIHTTSSSSTGNETEVVLPPIPIEWIIAPRNITSSDQCPNAGATIATFAATDLILAVFLIVTAARPLVYRATFHIFGKRGGYGAYWTWVMWLVLQVMGNVGAALLVVRSEGYEHLEFLKVFALYLSRPRLKAWWLAILRTLFSCGARRFPDGNKRLEEERKEEVEKVDLLDWEKYGYKEREHIYVDAYISAALVEIIFQITAAVFIGVTWERFPNEVIKQFMQPSLRYMFAVPGLTLVAILVGVPIWRLTGETWNWKEIVDRHPLTGKVVRRRSLKWGMACYRFWWVVWGCLFYIPVYSAAWVYWTHFLTLPGALWCPPKLVSQSAIWILTSI
ncbi:hypothetical protein B0T21DRAFT_371915 [Apiosordaria backusii]|uniref:Uncharacterized protein n=1 Tax=Apiosordaria backusii TaxID=314023 RepID=A0AA40B2R2_9PEZI|nr:hypothetical protein B0T21DRAFT_371915 [Apiosordaria backusii]